MSGSPRKQLAERHCELATGEVGTKTEMRAGTTEAHMGVWVAQDVEPLWVVKLPWVPVRHAIEQDDLVSFSEAVS